MLWESVDPTEQLARRFGFRDSASVAEWVADALQRRWELDVTSCDRVVISDWNVMAWVMANERRLIAKWSALPQRFARLGDSARIVSWLDSRGIPVAAPIPAADGRLLVEFDNDAKGRVKSRLPLPESRFLLGVLPAIEGDLLDLNDPVQVTDAGQMLAAVHEALASYPHQVGGRRSEGQEQLVHNDFRSANVLHNGTRITAVLDLEEVTYDTRVADLAKAAVLLGTRYRDWGPTSEGAREAFVAAYTEHTQAALTTAEQQELEARIAAVLGRMGWA
jgi:homoserine kinase type II